MLFSMILRGSERYHGTTSWKCWRRRSLWRRWPPTSGTSWLSVPRTDGPRPSRSRTSLTWWVHSLVLFMYLPNIVITFEKKTFQPTQSTTCGIPPSTFHIKLYRPNFRCYSYQTSNIERHVLVTLPPILQMFNSNKFKLFIAQKQFTKIVS